MQMLCFSFSSVIPAIIFKISTQNCSKKPRMLDLLLFILEALVIIGKSNKKELIKISNSDINFIDASKLWGKHTSETELILNKKIGSNYSYATIGPAGENLVRFAGIKNDGGRMAARTGVGAVMGSKNIKAIAVGGEINISISDPKKINDIRKNLSKKSLGDSTEKYRTTGTTINMSLLNRLEMLPTNNFSESIFKESEKIEGENLIKNHFSEKAHCANCTIGCEKIFVTNDKNAKIKAPKASIVYQIIMFIYP